MSGDCPKEGPDYFGFFTHELEELFSGENDADDDFLHLLGLGSDGIKKEMREKDVNGAHGSGGGEFGLKKSDFLFCDGLGGELSEYRKERLKGLLKQSVSVLTQEVDQMVDVVLATCQLQHQLRSKVTASGSQGSTSGDSDHDCKSRKRKKSKSLKVSDTPALVGPSVNGEPIKEDYLERPSKFKFFIDILSQNRESCANCNVTQTSMWRRTPDGARICNACGLRLRKGGLQLLPEKKDQTIAASQAEADKKNKEVTDDLKFLLDNDGLKVEQTMKKYGDEISSSLCHMEQQLEGFLDNVTSKCRNMTFFERQRLWKLIKDLPSQNFDRAVEIIKRSRGFAQQDENDILVDLEDTDNTVLWRLYYYAKAVENAQKLFLA